MFFLTLFSRSFSSSLFSSLISCSFRLILLVLSIHKYASCSKECFILALIYIDRLIWRDNFLLTELNVHRVIVTSVLLAAKFFDDAYYNNAYYAKVGGVLVEEMNNLEAQFLFKIDFSLRVLPEVFEKYEAELISHSNEMGLESIALSTDDELFRAVVPPPRMTPQQVSNKQYPFQQEVAGCHHSVVALPTHNQAEFIDYSFGYPVAAPSMEWPRQQQQQPPTMMAALDPVYPFHQVASAYQEQHPAELDPTNRFAAPERVAAAAHQDIALSRYAPCQANYHLAGTTTSAHRANDNDLVYPRYPSPAPSAPMTTDGLYPYCYHPVQDFNFAAITSEQQQPPAYSHHVDYLNFNNGRTTTRNVAQSHPEITPSPPPQPSMNFHGLPAYHDGEVGRPSAGLPSVVVGGASCGGVTYLTSSSSSSSSGVAAALQHSHSHFYANPSDAAMALHHRQHQMLPSHPIAIGDHHQYHHHVTQDSAAGGWSMLSQALDRGASLSGST